MTRIYKPDTLKFGENKLTPHPYPSESIIKPEEAVRIKKRGAKIGEKVRQSGIDFVNKLKDRSFEISQEAGRTREVWHKFQLKEESEGTK